jgi:vacuolar-type H+-ATPase subunit H
MTKEEILKEIKEYLDDADKAISENEEYIRGWKSAMLVALELVSKLK